MAPFNKATNYILNNLFKFYKKNTRFIDILYFFLYHI